MAESLQVYLSHIAQLYNILRDDYTNRLNNEKTTFSSEQLAKSVTALEQISQRLTGSPTSITLDEESTKSPLTKYRASLDHLRNIYINLINNYKLEDVVQLGIIGYKLKTIFDRITKFNLGEELVACPHTKTPDIFDLKRIWADKLYPLTKTSEMEALLYKVVIEETGLDPSSKQWERFPDEWKSFFRLSKEEFDHVRSLDKPWLYYPLAIFSPVEDPETYKRYTEKTAESEKKRTEEEYNRIAQHYEAQKHIFRSAQTPEAYKKEREKHAESTRLHAEKSYNQLVEDFDIFLDVLRRANSPEDVEWWVYMHRCETINGRVLLPLLRKAYPYKTFRVVSNGIHWFVMDELCQIYDLYWAQVGMQPDAWYFSDTTHDKFDIKFYREFPMEQYEGCF